MPRTFTLDRSNLHKFSLLKSINKGTQNQFYMLKLYHSRGFAITVDDRVLAFGDNSNFLLGLGHNLAVEQAKEIVDLRCKQIVEIVCGVNVNLARSKDGKVFQWGGLFGDKTSMRKPVMVIPGGVIELKCTLRRLLALTSSGTVLSWLGSSPPVVVETSASIVQIDTGMHHFMAVDDTGRVVCQGSNSYRQLGLVKRHLVCSRVVHVQTHQPIKQVVCGALHTFFLTCTGKLYITGRGRTLENASKPIHFGQNVVLTDIIVISNQFINFHDKAIFFFGVTSHQNVIVWCDDLEKSARSHSLLDRSLLDVICDYCKYCYVPGMIKIETSSFSSLHRLAIMPSPSSPPSPSHHGNHELCRRLAGLFDSPDMHDLQFTFKDDRTIHAHRVILAIGSRYFHKMLSETWKDLNRITIVDYSYGVYHRYVKYAYTSQLYLNPVSLSDRIDLVHLAVCHDEQDLLELCHADVIDALTTNNCRLAFKLASERSLEALKIQIADFIFANSEK